MLLGAGLQTIADSKTVVGVDWLQLKSQFISSCLKLHRTLYGLSDWSACSSISARIQQSGRKPSLDRLCISLFSGTIGLGYIWTLALPKSPVLMEIGKKHSQWTTKVLTSSSTNHERTDRTTAYWYVIKMLVATASFWSLLQQWEQKQCV